MSMLRLYDGDVCDANTTAIVAPAKITSVAAMSFRPSFSLLKHGASICEPPSD